MWTKEKEERYCKLRTEGHDSLTSSEIIVMQELEEERDSFIDQQLEKQGETRERNINDKEYLQLIAERLHALLPDAHGFICLAFPFMGGRMRYVSNCKREDAVKALKTWLIQASGEEDWMRHIK